VAVFAATRQHLDRVDYWTRLIDRPARGAERRYYIYTPRYARADELGASLVPLLGDPSAGGTAAQSEPRDTRSALESPSARTAVDNALRTRRDSDRGGNQRPAGTTVSVRAEDLTMAVDLRANALIFNITGTRYQALLPMIRRLDTPPRQVLLEATIAEVLLMLVYQSRSGPAGFAARHDAWFVGPPSSALDAATTDTIEAALAVLNDTTRPPADRLAAYRERLADAETLLLRGLRAQPAQARGLARLAAVRWELDPPTSPQQVDYFLEMIALAARMAPQSAGVQAQLGELLLKMSRGGEALLYLARAVELDATRSRDAVRLLTAYLVPTAEMVGTLPRTAPSRAARRLRRYGAR
jgi:hypothetical protein